MQTPLMADYSLCSRTTKVWECSVAQRNGLPCLPCVMCMLLYSLGAMWVIGGQHGVEACDEICKVLSARMGELEDRMTNFDVRIIKFDASVDIRRKVAG